MNTSFHFDVFIEFLHQKFKSLGGWTVGIIDFGKRIIFNTNEQIAKLLVSSDKILIFLEKSGNFKTFFLRDVFRDFN